MSLDRSLKTKPAGLNTHRNVLTRAERIDYLTQRDQFGGDDASPIGLVKVGNRQTVAKKKKKAATEDGEGTAEADAT